MSQEIGAKARLDSADQDGFGDASRATDGIYAKMVTIDEIDVAMAGAAKHDLIAWCRAGRAVTGRIVGEVGLGFDDDAAGWARGRIADEPMAEKLWRDDFGGWFVEGARERGERCLQTRRD